MRNRRNVGIDAADFMPFAGEKGRQVRKPRDRKERKQRLRSIPKMLETYTPKNRSERRIARSTVRDYGVNPDRDERFKKLREKHHKRRRVIRVKHRMTF
jgi:hypothetical protein